ncbi:MAG: 4Fe-4S ferredoxin, partial [Thermoprotei archaeon]
MQPEVYFLDYSTTVDVVEGVKELFKRAGLSQVVKGRVAVKLHIGEWGN